MLRWLSLFVLVVGESHAKFDDVFPGIATEYLQTCTANKTKAQYTARGSCQSIFACIMDSTSNSDQAILSSGAAVLGFIPTMLTILSINPEELIEVHLRFPILALLLSITNISTFNECLTTITPTKRVISVLRKEGLNNNDANSNTSDSSSEIESKRDNKMTNTQILALLVAYLLATIGAVTVLFQTFHLSRKAVVAWACWTNFYPIAWLVLGVLQHILSVLSLRFSLRKTDIQDSDNGADGDYSIPALVVEAKHRTRHRLTSITRRSSLETHVQSRSSWELGVWEWNLLSHNFSLEQANPNFAIWSKIVVDLLANVTFLYGTIVFSSLQLVSGVNSIKVVAIYGGVAAMTRVMTAFVLQNVIV